jgi:hypothetical protein
VLLSEHRQKFDDPFNEDKWLAELEKLAELQQEKRENQIPFKLYKRLTAGKQMFCSQVAPHVLSYLPEGTDIGATIYLTALEHPAPGYAQYPDIAYALSHPLYVGAAIVYEQTGAATVYNLLAHELFHIGYSDTFELSTEEHRKNEIVIDMLIALQNEGMATYVSYTLTSIYPAPFEWFHYLIDSELVVRSLIRQLNELFERADTKPTGAAYDEIYREIAVVGYRRNGFYIVGAYMAMTIEDKLGKEALMQTVADGFYSFVRVYNSVAEEGMKITGFSEPET